MTDVEQLLKNTVAELDRLLSAKNVLGDPIEKNGSTVIPIVRYGFKFLYLIRECCWLIVTTKEQYLRRTYSRSLTAKSAKVACASTISRS